MMKNNESKTQFEKEIEVKFIDAIRIFIPNCNNFEDIPFIIEFDNTIENLDSGLDEMLSFWSLPNIYGKVITFSTVLRLLILQDKMPLWIKLNLRFNNQIILTISKRFRGQKAIVKHHKNSSLQPFKFVEESYTNKIQKILERFFNRQELFYYELEELQKQHFSKENIVNIIKETVDKAKFYPNKFLKLSPVKATCKGLIIEKFEDDIFILHEQIRDENKELIMLPDKLFETIEDAIEEFINHFPTIYELKIIKK